jgi:hypothetical protein
MGDVTEGVLSDSDKKLMIDSLLNQSRIVREEIKLYTSSVISSIPVYFLAVGFIFSNFKENPYFYIPVGFISWLYAILVTFWLTQSAFGHLYSQTIEQKINSILGRDLLDYGETFDKAWRLNARGFFILIGASLVFFTAIFLLSLFIVDAKKPLSFYPIFGGAIFLGVTFSFCFFIGAGGYHALREILLKPVVQGAPS